MRLNELQSLTNKIKQSSKRKNLQFSVLENEFEVAAVLT